MTTKVPGLFARDGSAYSSLTDGAGNKITNVFSITTGIKKDKNSLYSEDGSIYITVTDSAGTIV